jgi:hypothetical protein
MQKANEHRSSILSAPLYQMTFQRNKRCFHRKVFKNFLTPCGSIFNASHETVWCLLPRFSRDNWALTTNPKSKSLIVFLHSRIAQIWPTQSSVCDTFNDSQERPTIILAIPGQIWSF